MTNEAAMNEPSLIEAVDDLGVATLTFNRPARSNAFDPAMRDLFCARLAALADDPGVRMLVLRGAGKHFSAGSDLSAMGQQSPEQRVEMLLKLDEFPKPVLALVHGACLGASLAMVLCCDVVVAAPDAFFSLPEVRLGIPPLVISPFLLRALSPATFGRYALSGERFDGTQARQMGLVHELCAADDFDRAAATTIGHLLHAGPEAARAFKRTLKGSCTQEFREKVVALAREESEMTRGPEAQEALARMKARERPSWYPPAMVEAPSASRAGKKE